MADILCTESNSDKALEKHFSELSLKNSQPLLVHSSLFSLVKLDNPAILLINTLKNYLLQNTALAVPSYVFDSNEEYNPLASVPSTGLVSKTVFNNAMGMRTYSPIHNHIFINSRIDPTSLNYTSSFGTGTDFEKFYVDDYRLLLFSIDFKTACTYLHHVESLACVPYRKKITIKKKLKLSDSYSESIELAYDARISTNIKTDFNKILPLIQEASSYQESKLNGFTSYAIDIRELHTIAMKRLSDSPNFFQVT